MDEQLRGFPDGRTQKTDETIRLEEAAAAALLQSRKPAQEFCRPATRRLFQRKRRRWGITQGRVAYFATVCKKTVFRYESGLPMAPEIPEKLWVGLAKAIAEKATKAFKPEHVRPRRLELRLTLRQLADLTEGAVCHRTIWEIEKGKCVPTDATLAAIEKALEKAAQNRKTGADWRRDRGEAGLTMAELASKADVGKLAIWQLENDKQRPKERTLKRIRGALEVAGRIPSTTELKTKRQELGLTAEELSEKAKVSLGTISRSENGAKLRPNTRRRLNEALNGVHGALNGDGAELLSGKDIRSRRIAAGWSQAGLARAIGISQQGMWYIEQEKFQPLLRTRRAIAEALLASKPTDNDQVKRLYPAMVQSAKRRRRGAGSPPPLTSPVMPQQAEPVQQSEALPGIPMGKRSRGRPTKEQTQKLYQFCHEGRTRGEKRAITMERANQKYGKGSITSESQVTSYAGRYKPPTSTGGVAKMG
jgi:predicted transcriptional regulator